MTGTVARREPRRRLTWPPDAPRVGIHLGTGRGLLRAARRARQVGAAALQIFSDNPTAWRRRDELPADIDAFRSFCAEHGIAPVAIHASYLINLAGSAEPFAGQSRAGLIHELRQAPHYGATLVNTHIGSHRGHGRETGLRRIAGSVAAILDAADGAARLVLENSSGGGENLGSRLEELAEILDRVGRLAPHRSAELAFCLDTAHLWGAGYDVATEAGASDVVERFDELIGLDRLVMIHLNDSRSERGSRGDRHEHLGAGRIGPLGPGALLRDRRLRHAAFVMETPGADEDYDAVNMRRAWLLHGGATELPTLPPKAFTLTRRSTRRSAPVRRRAAAS